MNRPKISQPSTVIAGDRGGDRDCSAIGSPRQRPEKSSVVEAVPGIAASGLSRTACTSVRQYDGRSASRSSSSATTSAPAWPLVGRPDSSDGGDHRLGIGGQHLLEHVGLGAEVAVHQRVVDAGPGGDLAHRETVGPALGDQALVGGRAPPTGPGRGRGAWRRSKISSCVQSTQDVTNRLQSAHASRTRSARRSLGRTADGCSLPCPPPRSPSPEVTLPPIPAIPGLPIPSLPTDLLVPKFIGAAGDRAADRAPADPAEPVPRRPTAPTACTTTPTPPTPTRSAGRSATT